MCEFLRNNGHIKKILKTIDQICADTCRFIQCEICHEQGIFFDPDSMLGLFEEYRDLRNLPQSLM
ncbi:hypothetical protein BAE44_0004554 [Dichanthelium oligosanthes]|uniref:Uncharacterized protein n=1 Tax=Dichanthelium oligosanthes TaxID=888268 RepID=A0A1E5WAM4_9POAL|nr:hypothetical protein BAE44_0004554 [Dichanthelium oligosanthes]